MHGGLSIIMTLWKLKTTMSSLKPAVEKHLRSSVVYKIECASCLCWPNKPASTHSSQGAPETIIPCQQAHEVVQSQMHTRGHINSRIYIAWSGAPAHTGSTGSILRSSSQHKGGVPEQNTDNQVFLVVSVLLITEHYSGNHLHSMNID